MFSRPIMRRITRQTVRLHTKDGQSFEGALIGVYADALALSHASILVEDGGKHSLSGDVLVPRENLSFLQTSVE